MDPLADIVPLARRELERARDSLARTGWEASERVHEARKALKRARALLLLLPPGRGARDGARAARDAARALGAARDAAALAEVVDRLCRDRPESAPDLAPVAAALAAGVAVREAPSAAALECALGAVALAVDGIDTASEATGASFAAGLRRAYASARRCWREAHEHPTADAFHELRKQSKAHAVHLGLVAPAWPAVLDAHAGTLVELGAALGDEHDLGLLLAALPSLPGGERCHEPVVTRRDERRAQALSLASRAFAERPRALTRRLEALVAAARSAPAAPDAWERVRRRLAKSAPGTVQE
ncbi:MAG: CHAD domain-containing protein [Polyangiaceae bacterium]|nr:CHAD domain-containing protein [Polyangiaceae bacterium]